jgi:hypothetical protein
VTRISCCIPGCRRTFKAEDCGDGDVMCGKHWRMGDQRLRDRVTRLGRIDRRIERLARRKAIRDCRDERDWQRLSDLFMRRSIRAWELLRVDVEAKAALGAEDAPRRKPRHSEEP